MTADLAILANIVVLALGLAGIGVMLIAGAVADYRASREFDANWIADAAARKAAREMNNARLRFTR